jgi:uncharacterized protein (DUF2345 family)
MQPMEYVFVPKPPKAAKQVTEERCQEATDAHWAESMVNRGYFPTIQAALMFLDSHKGITLNTDTTVFTKVNEGV